jgi:hypothetical protein
LCLTLCCFVGFEIDDRRFHIIYCIYNGLLVKPWLVQLFSIIIGWGYGS